jgi:pyruvate/2-oxoglutarate dehydrogenase complex dihydrolipoamide dehydrogenase (E3) component
LSGRLTRARLFTRPQRTNRRIARFPSETRVLGAASRRNAPAANAAVTNRSVRPVLLFELILNRGQCRSHAGSGGGRETQKAPRPARRSGMAGRLSDVTVRYDAIVIGTGQAGPSLAARLSKEGRRVAILERSRFGGTCVNTGCIPTKALVASARAMHVARRGAEFGFSTGGTLTVDMPRVKNRMDAIVGQSTSGIERWLTADPNITVYRGQGRFTGPRTVVVNDEVLEADQVFINVGGRAVVPAMPGVDEVPFLTNTSILALDTVPEHLAIVGGSYIGLEFAQIFRRFGSRVTVIEKGPRLIAREDDDVSSTLQQVLEEEGIAFRLNAACIGLRRTARGATVDVDCSQDPQGIDATHVLLAVGRRPNTDDLGLEAAGVATDARGFVVVDDQCRTNVEGVWALGECNGHGAFTHTAYHDYEVVASALFDAEPRGISDRITCYALFTDPPVGRAGMTLHEARASGRRLLMAHRPMHRIGRAKEMSETSGFMRAIVDADSERILGAVIFGAGGDEIIHSLLDVMYADAPYTVVARAVHIHPTITELIPTLLQHLKPLH